MIFVRPLTRDDAAAFKAVRLECLRLHPAAFGSTHADWEHKSISDTIARIEDGVIFGLFTNHGLQGLLAYDREKGGNARHRAGIHAVYVRDTLRGSGGIDQLIGACIDLACADGVAQLELSVAANNPRAIAAYLRHGFSRFATTPRALLVDGQYLDEIHMIRRLDP